MKRLRLITRPFCVLSLVLGASYSPLAFADGFTTIDRPGAIATTAYGISPSGDIVGGYADSSGKLHGYLLSDATFTNLDPPGASFGTEAMGINPRGDIVGYYIDSRGIGHGYLLSDGAFTNIDVPGVGIIFTAPSGINPQGDIVGFYVDSSGKRHGFLLSNHDSGEGDQGGEGQGSQGTFTTIDVPGAIFTRTFEINPQGDIAGTYYDSTGKHHGFLLTEGTLTSIDVPGFQTEAYGINPQGDIVGVYYVNGLQNGYLLSHRDDGEEQGSTGTFTTIDVPGATRSQTVGINARGDIVGHYFDSTGKQHGFLLSK